MNLDDIYRETILDHNQMPRNKGTLARPTHTFGLLNPTCGDRIRIDISIEDGIIADIRFDGQGCAISMASASMMTEAIKGRPVEEALDLTRNFKRLVLGQDPDRDLGELATLEGVARFPSRVKCATLAHNALQEALEGGRTGRE